MINVRPRSAYSTTVEILDWATVYLLDHRWRVNASSILVGASGGLFLFAGSRFETLFFLGMCLMALAFSVGLRSFRPRMLVVGIAILLLSAVVSIPGSLIWGPGIWINSAIIANWALLFAFLPFMKLDLRKVLIGLLPSLLLTAGLILFQGMSGVGGRLMAWVDSPNPAGGILVLGSLILLPTKLRWLALPMVVAVPFTGSRLAILTFIISVAVMLAVKALPLRFTLIFMVTTILILAPFTGSVAASTRISTAHLEHVGIRLTMLEIPGARPKGFLYDPARPDHAEYNGPPHSVPLRIGIEWGYLALVAWAGVTVWAMVRGYRSRADWQILLAVILLGTLDYYVHVGPLAWTWWLAIGLMFHSGQRFAMTTVHLPDGSPVQVLRLIS